MADKTPVGAAVLDVSKGPMSDQESSYKDAPGLLLEEDEAPDGTEAKEILEDKERLHALLAESADAPDDAWGPREDD